MPRPRKPPRIHTRTGRWGLFAYLDRDHAHVPLHTDDQAEASRRLATLLDERRLSRPEPGTHPLADIFDELHARAVTNHTRKTAYEVRLNLQRILEWLEGRQPPPHECGARHAASRRRLQDGPALHGGGVPDQ